MGMRRAGVTGAIVLALATVASADEPTHSFITASDGLRVHYIEQGTGTPVVLIHGARVELCRHSSACSRLTGNLFNKENWNLPLWRSKDDGKIETDG